MVGGGASVWSQVCASSLSLLFVIFSSEDTFSGATLRNAAGNPMRPDGILLDKDGVRMMAKVGFW